MGLDMRILMDIQDVQMWDGGFTSPVAWFSYAQGILVSHMEECCLQLNALAYFGTAPPARPGPTW